VTTAWRSRNTWLKETFQYFKADALDALIDMQMASQKGFVRLLWSTNSLRKAPFYSITSSPVIIVPFCKVLKLLENVNFSIDWSWFMQREYFWCDDSLSCIEVYLAHTDETTCELSLNSERLNIDSRRLKYRITLRSELNHLSWILILVATWLLKLSIYHISDNLLGLLGRSSCYDWLVCITPPGFEKRFIINKEPPLRAKSNTYPYCDKTSQS
jgi:hypothetical protein